MRYTTLMESLLHRARSRLQQRGGRMTRQRQLIIETLAALGGHPSAEEVYRQVVARDPRIHLSTVYRTLRWLQEEGLIQGRVFDESQRKERFDPHLPAEHFHFICRRCGQVTEFLSPPEALLIASQFARRTGNHVESVRMTLYGVCQVCQAGEG